MPPRLNIPPITRILLIALVSQSLLSFAIRYRQWSEESDIVVPYLALVPQLSLIYPWTFLTTTLVENNVFTLGIAGLTIFYGGRYLERAWTSAEFAKFLLIAALIPNAICFGTLVILFAVTGDISWTWVALSSTLLTPFALLLIQICQFDNHQWHNTFTNFLPRGLLPTRTRAYCHPFPWHCFPPSPPISAPPYPRSALAITHASLECSFFLLGNQWLSNQLDVFAIL